jgi:chemotaxis signal transduction protein
MRKCCDACRTLRQLDTIGLNSDVASQAAPPDRPGGMPSAFRDRTGGLMATTAIAEPTGGTRVLVFTVDDACLCVDLDRVDTVYARSEARLHALKPTGSVGRSFLIHRNEPALIVDLREAFGLSEILGVTDRAAFMVMRAGSFPLAVPVDMCVGVRDLDLETRTPVPTTLQRDGGFSVGHLVALDGKIHTLLEPTRILSSTLREHLEPFLQAARAFCERENEIAALAAKLRDDTTVLDLKAYARLTRRNGQTRAAAAARVVLKALQESEQHADDSATVAQGLTTDGFLRGLLVLSAARQTGEVQLPLQDSHAATIFFAAGHIADARTDGTRGRAAFKRILSAHTGAYRFIASDVPVHPRRIEDAAPWLLVETIEQLSEGRRGRHAR